MTADLAILYEHPSWFAPLFAALDRRGVDYRPILLTDHLFDPASDAIPARVVLSRVAMSSFLRDEDHGIFYAQALLAHWAAKGARVINGADVLAIDTSKARQIALIADLGLDVPATRVVHRPAELAAAAAAIGYPVLLKPNVGGSGSGITRYGDAAALAEAVAERFLPQSVDRVLLVQDPVPARGGTIIRVETLAGRFLYAIEVEAAAGSYDLCPADACLARPGHDVVGMRAVTPPAQAIAAAERIVQAAGIEVGGVEYLVDDRDGALRYYDINALSNFVADPLNVLGWDPHERLVDWLEAVIEGKG
jgi:hypothetical protein